MKKYLIIALLLISATAFGQLDTVNIGTGNNSRNGDPLRTAFIKINAGLHKLNAFGVDSMIVSDDGKLIFLDAAGDTIPPYFTVASIGNLFDYAARKYLVDTVLVTGTTLTLAATHAGQIVRFSHATYQEVTIPANTIPVGSIITFIKTGAGPIRVNPGASVVRKSVLDSCTMNTVNQTYQILFRTTNKVEYIGNWVD